MLVRPDARRLSFRTVTIGDSYVGKTSIVNKFIHDRFDPEEKSTVGALFDTYSTEYCGHSVEIQIWDTAGQEKFRTITKAYYRGAHGILLVYDVTSVESFKQTRQWMQSIRENMVDPVSIIFVGNKCDMQREVSRDEAEALAREFGTEYAETSAKNGTNVEETFMRLATLIVDSQKDKVQSKAGGGVALAKPAKKSGEKGCC